MRGGHVVQIPAMKMVPLATFGQELVANNNDNHNDNNNDNNNDN